MLMLSGNSTVSRPFRLAGWDGATSPDSHCAVSGPPATLRGFCFPERTDQPSGDDTFPPRSGEPKTEPASPRAVYRGVALYEPRRLGLRGWLTTPRKTGSCAVGIEFDVQAGYGDTSPIPVRLPRSERLRQKERPVHRPECLQRMKIS